MSEQPYLTLAGRSECEIPAIKGSRFIGIAAPIVDDAAAQVLVAEVQSRFADARHWCWAYQLREQHKTRFADDGEPSGSAGKPILAPIIGRELMDTMVVVVRYFGGVKLGVGGLVRAYSQAANAALDVADRVTVTPKLTLMLSYHYADTGAVAAALAGLNLIEENPIYTDRVETTLSVTPAQKQAVIKRLTDYTGGRATITEQTE